MYKSAYRKQMYMYQKHRYMYRKNGTRVDVYNKNLYMYRKIWYARLRVTIIGNMWCTIPRTIFFSTYRFCVPLFQYISFCVLKMERFFCTCTTFLLRHDSCTKKVVHVINFGTYQLFFGTSHCHLSICTKKLAFFSVHVLYFWYTRFC